MMNYANKQTKRKKKKVPNNISIIKYWSSWIGSSDLTFVDFLPFYRCPSNVESVRVHTWNKKIPENKKLTRTHQQHHHKKKLASLRLHWTNETSNHAMSLLSIPALFRVCAFFKSSTVIQFGPCKVIVAVVVVNSFLSLLFYSIRETLFLFYFWRSTITALSHPSPPIPLECF